jgi:hypothetical protein
MSEPDYKIDPNYLRGKLADLSKQVGGKPLLPIFIEQTRKVLGKSLTAYLRYGPYWWAMKRILRAGGLAVGTYDEPTWADEYAIKGEDGAVSPELTLLAAWEFGDDNIGGVGVLTSEYELPAGTLVLYDPDQAARA